MAMLNETKKKIQQTASVPAATSLPISVLQNPSQNTAQTNDYLQRLQSNPMAQIGQQAWQQAQQAQQQATQKQQAQQNNGYTGLQGLSAGTSQKLGNLQQGYNPSQMVTAAQQQLQSVLDQKPQTYSGKYDDVLESVLQRITNPEPFKYEFNGDNLFKSLADRYVQQGKQASLDAQGQAAALTGGYGNSFGQMVGQQTYDQYLQGLNDKGIDLYDRAWQRYQAGQDQLMDQFGVLSQADQTDYGRHRDNVGDWENERDFWTGRADTESDRDYGRNMDQLNYWTQMAGAENADYNTQQQMAEQKRQWDTQFEYNKMSDERKYAYDQATAILANGKLPTDTLLKAAGISKTDAKRMMAQAKTGRGGSGSGGGGKEIYRDSNGVLWTQDSNGSWKQIDEKEISKNDTVYTGNEAAKGLYNGPIKEAINKMTNDALKALRSSKK